MIEVRKSEERGHVDHGWLDTYHTFSFAHYYDPRFVGFRDLLVINEDRVQGGQGFGKHPHRNMEILTYILEGELEHKDSVGSSSVIRPNVIQRMSAGTGIIHSEFNHSPTKPVHLLQIWIKPEREGLKPSYEEKVFAPEDRQDRLQLIASPTGAEDSLKIHQDTKIYASLLAANQQVRADWQPSRFGWLQIARGSVQINGVDLHPGDGAAISLEKELEIVGREASEFLLFDLP